jgi:hypothetical protein
MLADREQLLPPMRGGVGEGLGVSLRGQTQRIADAIFIECRARIPGQIPPSH